MASTKITRDPLECGQRFYKPVNLNIFEYNSLDYLHIVPIAT